MNDAANMLLANNICKSFQQKDGKIIQALDSVSLSVRPGCIAALVGPEVQENLDLFIPICAGQPKSPRSTI